MEDHNTLKQNTYSPLFFKIQSNRWWKYINFRWLLLVFLVRQEKVIDSWCLFVQKPKNTGKVEEKSSGSWCIFEFWRWGGWRCSIQLDERDSSTYIYTSMYLLTFLLTDLQRSFQSESAATKFPMYMHNSFFRNVSHFSLYSYYVDCI